VLTCKDLEGDSKDREPGREPVSELANQVSAEYVTAPIACSV
jgi:hypothetical protein